MTPKAMDCRVNIFQSYVSNAAASRSAIDLGLMAKQFREIGQGDWTIPEAYLCLLLSAAYADGKLTCEERQEVTALAMRCRTLKTLSRQQLAHANAIVNERLRCRPRGMQEACYVLPMDMRLTLFAHCVDIVLADGELAQSEATFLDSLVQMLELNIDVARQILEVMFIKNRY